MSNSFSHFVLLGAGTATNFDSQIQNSHNATLVEARPLAAQKLRARFNNPQIKILESLISDQEGSCIFSHYNLPEFSAILPADGLTQLYPGLKITAQETMATEAVQKVIAELNLSGDHNALAIDILDINLRLLRALQSHGLLARFQTLFIKTSKIALYTGAASQSEVVQFLEQRGFSLQASDTTDPDVPNLTFITNPLQRKIQDLEFENAKLKSLLEETQNKSKLDSELKTEVDQKNKEVSLLKKSLTEKEAKINELQATSEKLKAQVQEEKFRNDKLIIEAGKLEAQIELIAKLLLNNKVF